MNRVFRKYVGKSGKEIFVLDGDKKTRSLLEDETREDWKHVEDYLATVYNIRIVKK